MTGRQFHISSMLVLAALVVGCGLSDDQGNGDEESPYMVDRPECRGTWTGGRVQGAEGVVIDVPSGAVSLCSNLGLAPSVSVQTIMPDDFPITMPEENVVTSDGDVRFIDSGDGFVLSPGSFVTLTVPYSAFRFPVGAVEDSTNTFVRIYEPERDVASDVHGVVDVNNHNVTVQVIGLPPSAVVSVIHRPARRAVAIGSVLAAAPRSWNATDFPPWPGRDWCVIHDYDSVELRDAVRKSGSVESDPTPQMIAQTALNKVAAAARVAQATYEGLGLRAPWLYVSSDPAGPCGDVFGSTPRYELQLIDGQGSHYKSQDPDEATGPGDRRFGRIYIRSSRIGDDSTSVLGSVKASVAHEMLHAVQMGYEILVRTVEGLNEGTATVAGLTIDTGSVGVRAASDAEIFRLPWYLMVDRDGVMYSNQDFFAFVARRYGGGTLALLPVVFQAMRDSMNSLTSSATTDSEADAFRLVPGTRVVHQALDNAIGSAMSGLNLRQVYADFLIQRALEHGPESVFGRAGETTSGLADELFGGTTGQWGMIREVSATMSECGLSKHVVKLDDVYPFAARAVRITATDVSSPARKATLNVSVSGDAGQDIVAYGMDGDLVQTIEGAMTFEDFGSWDGQALEMVVAMAGWSMDKTIITVELDLVCDEPGPQGEDPMKCGSSGIPACNDVPAEYYWRRGCEEYTGSHWASDWQTLKTMCGFTNGAEWCDSGCSRSNVLGTCSESLGDNAEVVYYFYTTVDYAAQNFDPAANCALEGGTWSGR